MRPTLIAGNWKMNGSRKMASELVGHLTELGPFRCQVVLIPPFVLLDQVGKALAGSGIRLGAQDVDAREGGAVTGGVSAPMLVDQQCGLALVGHSERRMLFGESNEDVAEKFAACLDHGISPILCIGETLEERDLGKTLDVVVAQLNAVADRVGAAGFGSAIIAYEPVWAIGTGKSATPEEAQAVHEEVRAWLIAQDKSIGEQLPLLYGGSVNGQNAGELLSMADIDGALVGGASLKAEEFASICTTAADMVAAG